MAEELTLLVKLTNELSGPLKDINADITNATKSWKGDFQAVVDRTKEVSLALVAFGTVITGAFALAYRSAEEEASANARLNISLMNIGVSYDNVSVALNTQIEAQRRATGISRGEQVDALQNLILATGDYAKAVKLLPLAMDLAKAKQMDVATSALLLGRVAEGDINVLNRYGFSMDGVKTAGDALNVVQEKVGGTAAAVMSPIDLLKTSMEQLGEAIGDLMKGPFGTFLTDASLAVDNVVEWTTKNPELAKTILEVAFAIGVASIAVGTLGLVFVAVMTLMKIFGGPIGWLIIGIELLATALVAAGIYIWMNWDQVSHNLAKIWNDMGLAFMDVGDGIIGGVEWVVNGIIAGVNAAISALNKLTGANISMISNWKSARWSDIFERKEMDWWTPPVAGQTTPGTPGATGVAPLTSFGNYGNGGQTIIGPGGITVTVNNAGSVISDKDLVEQIRQMMIDIQNRNGSTGIK